MQVNKNKSSSKLLLVYTNGMFNVQLGVLSSKSITSQTLFSIENQNSFPLEITQFNTEQSSTLLCWSLSLGSLRKQGIVIPIKAMSVVAAKGYLTRRASFSGVAVPPGVCFDFLTGTQDTGLEFTVYLGDGHVILAGQGVTALSHCVHSVILIGRVGGQKGLFKGCKGLGWLLSHPAWKTRKPRYTTLTSLRSDLLLLLLFCLFVVFFFYKFLAKINIIKCLYLWSLIISVSLSSFWNHFLVLYLDCLIHHMTAPFQVCFSLVIKSISKISTL